MDQAQRLYCLDPVWGSVFLSIDCSTPPSPPTYHRMDGTIVEMPPSYRKYFDRPDWSGAAPPPSALPMPKFFQSRPAPAKLGKVTDSNNDKKQSKSPAPETLSTTAAAQIAISTDQPLVDAGTDEREPDNHQDECATRAINNGKQHAETKQVAKMQVESQISITPTWASEKYRTQRISSPGRLQTLEAKHRYGLKSLESQHYPTSWQQIRDPFIHWSQNEAMLYHLQAQLEINLTKQYVVQRRLWQSQTSQVTYINGQGV